MESTEQVAEELIEDFIQAGMKAFKIEYGKTPEGQRLWSHRPVEVQGHTFTCWREYTVFKMGLQIQEWCPHSDIRVELDGSKSSIEVELTAEDFEVLDRELHSYKEQGLV